MNYKRLSFGQIYLLLFLIIHCNDFSNSFTFNEPMILASKPWSCKGFFLELVHVNQYFNSINKHTDIQICLKFTPICFIRINLNVNNIMNANDSMGISVTGE